jgi:hypothetical protein
MGKVGRPIKRTAENNTYAPLKQRIYIPLWASLKDIADRQENHQRTTLIVLKDIL